MITIILVIHLLLALSLIVVVLLQRSEGGALGIGGSGGGGGGFGLMSARGTANLLTRATAVIAACFIATSLILAILAGGDRAPASILDQPAAEQSQPQQPAVPLSQ